MTNRIFLNEGDLRIAKLRQEICEKLPNGSEWLNTPHELLAGQTPEQRDGIAHLPLVESAEPRGRPAVWCAQMADPRRNLYAGCQSLLIQ